MCKIAMVTYTIISTIIVFFSLVAVLSLNWQGVTLPNLEQFVPKIFGG